MDDIVLKKITNYLHNQYNIDVTHLNEDTKILGRLDLESGNSVLLSSLEYVEFIVYIENEFNIIFDFDEDINTVRDIREYIFRHADDRDYLLKRISSDDSKGVYNE